MQAFVLWLRQKKWQKASELKIAVGHDSRISAPMLKQQALMAIVAQGATAVDCSMATTPAMFMSLVYEETKYLLTDHDEYQRMANTCNPYVMVKLPNELLKLFYIIMVYHKKSQIVLLLVNNMKMPKTYLLSFGIFINERNYK